MSTIKAPPIHRIIISQFATAVGLGLPVFVLADWTATYSVVIGGVICALANAYFARKAFMYTGARAAAMMVKSIYAGEAIKLLLVSAGFALAFVFVKPLDVVFLFAGYIATHVVGVIATIRLQKQTVHH